MIGLYACREDVFVSAIARELTARGTEVLWLVHSEFGADQFLAHRVGRNGKSAVYLVRDGRKTNLNEISVMIGRQNDSPVRHPGVKDPALQESIGRQTQAAIEGMLESLECPWFPAMSSWISKLERCKFTHLRVAARCGFRVPDTLVTSDPGEALDFYRNHDGRIIVKGHTNIPYSTLSGQMSTKTVVVAPSDMASISDIAFAPVYLQELLPKAYELRVTVIGREVVAAKIESQQTHRTMTDWRSYDFARTPYTLYELPDEVRTKCVNVVKALGLHYGAMDLVRTPDGEYVYLETNPCGQYGWVGKALRVSITDLICDHITDLGESRIA